MAALASPAAAQAPDGYPARPIRLVVGFAPGGLTDIYARLFAAHLQKVAGQGVIVENKPGAATMIGTTAVAKAPPDGYTLCFCVTNVFTNQFFRDTMPYRTEELVPVSLGFKSSSVLLVPANSPFKSARELADAARGNPEKLTYSTTGAGGATHITGELFASVTRTRSVAVHYKGASPATSAVASGEVDFTFSAIATAQPPLTEGRVRALGVANEERVGALPDVPTMAEVGFEGVASGVWYGLMAPAGTARPIVDYLNKVSNDFFGSKEIRERLLAGGETPLGNATPEAMAAYIERDTAALRKIIVPMNLKLD
jgi:tripartite-type tricarboxylate transporter receptor subunit TctC